MFLCNWHVFRRTMKFKLLYFRNEARYRAKNMQTSIFLKPLVADLDKNSKGSLVFSFTRLYQHSLEDETVFSQ